MLSWSGNTTWSFVINCLLVIRSSIVCRCSGVVNERVKICNYQWRFWAVSIACCFERSDKFCYFSLRPFRDKIILQISQCYISYSIVYFIQATVKGGFVKYRATVNIGWFRKTFTILIKIKHLLNTKIHKTASIYRGNQNSWQSWEMSSLPVAMVMCVI